MAIKEIYFRQKDLPNTFENKTLVQQLIAKILLFVFILKISFVASFVSGLFGSLSGLYIIVGTDSRLEFILALLVVCVWLFSTVYQNINKTSIIVIISVLFAIMIQELVGRIYSSIFTNLYFFVTFIAIMLVLIFAAISLFIMRFSIALFNILFYSNKNSAAILFFLITCCGSIVGSYAEIFLESNDLESNYRGALLASNNLKIVTIVFGVTFSSVVTWSAILANHFRCVPWSYPGLLRSWTLAVGSWLGTSFYNLDLSNVNFTGAKLPNTDLRAKKLYRTCFQGVVGLERARVDNRYLDLAYPKVQKLLTHQSSPDPNFRSFNLRGAYLQGKDMRGFDFTEANLTGADCKDAKLQNANFTHAQIIDVDFTNANLTGICIADWSVNDQTKFTNVQCDYVYRKLDKNDNPTDRFPCDRNFEPREFESLYQEIGNVAELIFKEGVNWRAFAFTLQKLQLEDEGLGLQLKGIEKRGDLWVVKVTHNEDIPTAQVEQQLKANYGNLQRQLANKEQQINQLLGIVSNQAESLKELSKKPFGNYFTITGSTITNLAGGQIEYTEAADQIRSLVAGSSNQQPMTSVAQTFLEQLQNQNIATSPDTQMELIKQIILSEAQKDKIFGQFILQQGQQIIDTLPNNAIASAIQAAIAQLRIEVVE